MYKGKEDNFQIALAKYLNYQYPNAFWFHCPNGGYRTNIGRMKFAAMGVKPGIPDFLILEQRHGYTGLALEIKAGYKKPTPVQKECLREFKRLGYKAEWTNDFTKAKNIIDNYFNTNNILIHNGNTKNS